MNTALHSLAMQHQVDSFDSDDDFDVVSIDESVEECIEAEDEQQEENEWEDVANEDTQLALTDAVEIALDEGFQDAIEASMEEIVFATAHASTQTGVVYGMVDAGTVTTVPLSSPRRRSARESLREFYLARARASESSSKNYQHREPQVEPAPVVIAPLRAAERYDVELFEHVTRDENARKAQLALQDFYAKREAEKARRAVANRANERLVYQSQSGGNARGFRATGSSAHTLHSDTTRFVNVGVLSA